MQDEPRAEKRNARDIREDAPGASGYQGQVCRRVKGFRFRPRPLR